MPDSFIEEIARAFAERGGHAYGEDVSQLDHALQCGALALEEGAGDHLTVAALLHDYGHLLEGDSQRQDRDAQHESLGAATLRRWFGPAIVQPIALHVQAKRYLCAIEPDYLETLSPASTHSLELQGGPMTPDQCQRFETSQFAIDALRLRRWDDAGKVKGRSLPSLDSYWPILRRATDP